MIRTWTLIITRHEGRLAPTLALALLLASLLALGGAQTGHAQDWSPPRTVYFPETGHTLDQVFLDAWREAGGAASYGYPITPEITLDDGTIVQYLQYARFEYHTDGTFALGNIGEELRPFTVQRSVASLTSTSGEHGTGAANGAEVARAWLPVDPPVIESAYVRYVGETQHTVRYAFRDFWEATGGVAYLGNPLTEQYVIDGITYQVFERGQLAWENGSEPWLVPVGQVLADKYGLSQEPVAQGDIPTYSEDLFVPPVVVVAGGGSGPGPVPGASKSIVVSISEQRMWAYEGGTVVLSTLVSTGRPGFDTPTGDYSVVVKLPVEDMEGLIGGEYYNVTDVPDVMYFTGVGHAIHGTYWHNNFGSVMSHGCINLPLDVAAWLYDWTPMGTPVRIVP